MIIPDVEVVEILPEDIDIDILYEDKDIIVVNKPQGMVVHPAVGHMAGTYLSMHFCITVKTSFLVLMESKDQVLCIELIKIPLVY